MSSESTITQSSGRGSTPKPWQSWGWTVRYLVVCMAQAALNVVFVWLVYAHLWLVYARR